MPKIQEILAETRAFVETKKAEFTDKQGLAGQDPNTLPGAENDKPVDAGAKAPDPQVKEEPGSAAGGYSAEGATPASKKEQGTALDATDAPPATVKKEPEVSADAMVEPKSAELANDLLAAVKKAQEKAAADPAAADAAAPAEGTADPAADAAAATDPAADGTAKPAAATDPAAEGTAKPAAAVEAAPQEIVLNQEVLAKIAETLLATEEGWDLVEGGLAKAAGAEAAKETMDFLAEGALEAEKQAAYKRGQDEAEAAIQTAIYNKGREDAMAEVKEATAPAAPVIKNTAANLAQAVKQAAETLKATKATAAAPAGGATQEDLQKLGRNLADASVKAAQAELGAAAGGLPPELAALAGAEGAGAAPAAEGAEGALAEMGAAQVLNVPQYA